MEVRVRSLALLFLALARVIALPQSPLRTWDPPPHEEEQFNEWLQKLRHSINNMDWNAIEQKDFIGHDKFNIADGFDVDLLIVEEIQLRGDPVRKVELEMDRKRVEEQKKRVDRLGGKDHGHE